MRNIAAHHGLVSLVLALPEGLCSPEYLWLEAQDWPVGKGGGSRGFREKNSSDHHAPVGGPRRGPRKAAPLH